MNKINFDNGYIIKSSPIEEEYKYLGIFESHDILYDEIQKKTSLYLK